MIALLKYNYKVNIKCNKLLIPLLIFGIFQLIYYSTAPVDFTSSMIICGNILFFIMAWIGFSYCEAQDCITEQIVFLKVNKNKIYWISKILFMWSIGIVVSLIVVIWPLVINILNNGRLLDKKVILNDVLLGLFILTLVAFMGSLLGMILQTKIIGNSSSAAMILFLVALLSAIKGPLIKEFPIAKAITWTLPPIYDVFSSCMDLGRFSLTVLSIPIIYSVFYIFIEIFIYIKLMKRLLF